MLQLRSFVHHRFYAAAEEIIGEVERTIKIVLYEAQEEVESLRHQLDLLQQKSAEEPSLTSRTVEHGDGYDAPLLQENPGPSSAEESNFSTEATGASQTSTDVENNNWNNCFAETDFKVCKIKEEMEDYGENSQMQNFVFPPPEIVKSEQDQPEILVSYEMHAVPLDCSGAQCEDKRKDEELVNSNRKQTKTMKRNQRMLQGQSDSDNATDPSALPHDKCSGKRRSFCHLCGKGFLYIGPLMKHMKTHEKRTDCTVCGITYRSTKRLIAHLKRHHNKTLFCEICGQTFDNEHHLQQHEGVHTGKEEFMCQECGKTFSRRDYLIVHVRIHSGERPYQCDICNKAFTQSQHLIYHKRTHSGEKPYPCSLCGKHFDTTRRLKIHLRYHLAKKPYSCDICGKRFHQSGQVTRHKMTHARDKRYRFAPNPKEHLQSQSENPDRLA